MDRERLAINRGGDSGHIAPTKQCETSGDGRMSNSSIAESLPEDPKHLPSQDRWIKLATLILVCASIFMLPLDYTIVAVALHDI
jgi:hypothetical protein